MKKIFYPFLFTSAILFFAVVNSNAQFSLGLKGGLSIPNLTAGGNNPVSSGWSSRLGPYFGLVGEYKLSGRFDLQAQLNYSSQGGKKNGEQAIPGSEFAPYFEAYNQPVPKYLYANYNSVAKLNYMELPVLAKLNFTIGKKTLFFVNAGPYFGYLLSAKDINNGSGNIYTDEKETQPLPIGSQSFDTTANIKDQVHTFNAGIQGGIGLQFSTGKGELFFAAGGNYGFINIQKYSEDGKNDTGAATLAFGYLIKL